MAKDWLGLFSAQTTQEPAVATTPWRPSRRAADGLLPGGAREDKPPEMPAAELQSGWLDLVGAPPARGRATLTTALEEAAEHPWRMAPVVGEAAIARELGTALAAARKIEAGEALSRDEQDLLLQLDDAGTREGGIGYAVGSILTALPAWWGSMGVSRALLKAGARKVAGRALRDAAESAASTAGKGTLLGLAKRAGKGAAEIAGVVGVQEGLAAGAGLLAGDLTGGRIVAGMYQRAIPELELTDIDAAGEVAIALRGAIPDMRDVLWPALADALIETGTEMFGGEAASQLMRIPGLNRLEALGAGAVRWLSGETGLRGAQLAREVARRGGVHGVLGEWLEERQADVLRVITPGHEDFGQWGRALPEAEQAAAEFLAFSATGGLVAGAGAALGAGRGDRGTVAPQAGTAQSTQSVIGPTLEQKTPAQPAQPAQPPEQRTLDLRLDAQLQQIQSQHGGVPLTPVKPREGLQAQITADAEARGTDVVWYSSADEGAPDGASVEEGTIWLRADLSEERQRQAYEGVLAAYHHESVHDLAEKDPQLAGRLQAWFERERPGMIERATASYEADVGAVPEGLAAEEGIAEVSAGLAPLLWHMRTNEGRAELEGLFEDNRSTFKRLVEVVLDGLNKHLGADFQTHRRKVSKLLADLGMDGSDVSAIEAALVVRDALDALIGRVPPKRRLGPAGAEDAAPAPKKMRTVRGGALKVETPPVIALGAEDEAQSPGQAPASVAPMEPEGTGSLPPIGPAQEEGRTSPEAGASADGEQAVAAIGAELESSYSRLQWASDEEGFVAIARETGAEIIERHAQSDRHGRERVTFQVRLEDGSEWLFRDDGPEAGPRYTPVRTRAKLRAEIPTDGPSRFATRLQEDKPLTIVEARKIGREFGLDGKALDESIELGSVLAAREIVADGGDPEAIFDALLKLYERQPRLQERTSGSLSRQAYSTPLPIGYLASQLAQVQPGDVVLEPTAGFGALLLGADPATTSANELDDVRAAGLVRQGFSATQNDATEAAFKPADVVVTNPPFGKVNNQDGKGFRWFETGHEFRTPHIDKAIALRALDALKPGGRAVLILAGKKKLGREMTTEEMANAYNTADELPFWHTVYGKWRVEGHFSVDGKLYDRQGAAWPIDVVVIRGRGASTRKLPSIEPPRRLKTWEELRGLLSSDLVRTTVTIPAPGGSGSTEGGGGDAGNVQGGAGGEAAPSVDAGGRRGGKGPGGRSGGRKPRGRSDRPAPSQPGQAAEPGGSSGGTSGPGAENALATPTAGGVQEPGGSGGFGLPDAGGLAGGGAAHQAGALGGDEPRVERTLGTSESALQVSYAPTSRLKSLETVVPANQVSAIEKALTRLKDEVGPLDEYVAGKLGMPLGQLADALAGEQVDAAALAIFNIEAGKAFILGDQTGIGKGRVVASVLKYAERIGKIPVFVTAKPGLYADMLRDIAAIGWQANPLVTNFGLRGKEAIPLDGGGKLSAPPPAKLIELLRQAASGKMPAGYTAMFTTYSQLQTVAGELPERVQVLERLAQHSVIVFDESHLAGGTGEAQAGEGRFGKKKEGRSDVARRMAANSHGVFFSSATFAKNPDVLTLYMRTDMSLAVDNSEELVTAIREGGVPFQQMLSAMLVRSGQYLRREKSYDGITFPTEIAELDHAAVDAFASGLRRLFQLDQSLEIDRKEWAKEARAEAKRMGNDSSIGKSGAGQKFSSIMHNLIGQFLLASKAKAAGEAAVQAIRNGERPLIGVANTMEAALSRYAEDAALSYGDAVTDFDFRALLRRYLERMQEVPVKDPMGNVKRIKLPLSQARASQIAEAAEEIEALDVAALPVSPIDAMRRELELAGFSVEELTGRKSRLVYHPDGRVTYERLETSEAIKKTRMAAFNKGSLDALILNQSGATGYSLHAQKGGDTRPRRMILAQAEANPDTFMQLFGRINRTGQVKPPRYTILVADAPAEKRVTANMLRKLASLNANVTSSRKGVIDISGSDFINEVGDEVVRQWLKENEGIAEILDIDSDKEEGLASQFTGRLPILSEEDQSAILREIEERFDRTIEELNSRGENPLEAKAWDVDAQAVGSPVVIREDLGGNTPFTAAAYAQEYSLRKQKRPPSFESAIAYKPEGIQDAASIESELKSSIEDAAADLVKQVNEGELTKDEANAKYAPIYGRAEIIRGYIKTFRPGATLEFTSKHGVETAYVYGIEKKKGGKAENLGSYYAVYAVAETGYVAHRSLSSIFKAEQADEEDVRGIELSAAKAVFDEQHANPRESRILVTGNLVAGYAAFGGVGTIGIFKAHDGSAFEGVALPNHYDWSMVHEFLKTVPVRLTAAQSAEYLRRVGGAGEIQSEGRGLLLNYKDGAYVFRVASHAKELVKFREVTDKIGEFVQRRGEKFWKASTTSFDTAASVLRLYEERFVKFEAVQSRETAIAIVTPGVKFRKRRRMFVSFDMAEESKVQKARRLVQDDFLRVKEFERQLEDAGGSVGVERSSYRTQERMSGRIQHQLLKLRRDYVHPIKELMTKLGVDPDELGTFVLARHAPERNAWHAERDPEKWGNVEESPGSGMATSEANAYVAERAGPEWSKVGELVDAMNLEYLALRLKMGLITQEQFDEWTGRWNHYVPLRTYSEPTFRGGRAYGVSGAEFKRSKGRSSMADNPLLFSFDQASAAIIRGETNNVGRSFYKLLQANSDLALWQERDEAAESAGDGEREPQEMPLGEHEFRVKVDGKTKVIALNDALLARALRRLGADNTSRLVRMFGAASRFIAAANTTFSPEFLATNLMRDIISAGINVQAEGVPGIARQIIKDVMTMQPARAVWNGLNGKENATEWGRAFEEYDANGGRAGWYTVPTFDRWQAEFEKIKREIEPTPAQKALKLLRKAGEAAEYLSLSGENSVRLAVYRRLRERGVSVQKAASVAKNLTVNFNRKGEWGPTITALYTFANAGIQGTATFLSALSRSSRVRSIAAGLVAASFFLDLLNRWFGCEDTDGQRMWDKVPEWHKGSRLAVMAWDCSGRYVTVPMPYGYRVFSAAGSAIASMLPKEYGGAGWSPAKGTGFLAGALWESFYPLGGEGSTLQAIMPTLADPVVQHLENQNWAGSPIRPDQKPYGPRLADSALYWSSKDGTILQRSMAGLNRVTGGDEVTSGLVDVSPETVEHAFEFIFGGAGRFVTRTSTAIENGINGKMPKLYELPFVRQVASEIPDWYVSGQFWDNRERLRKIKARVDNAIARGRSAEAVEIKREYGAMLLLEKDADSIGELYSKEKKRGSGADFELPKPLETRMRNFNKRFLQASEH